MIINIPALEKQGQEYPWGSLAIQLSLHSEQQASERPSLENKREKKERKVVPKKDTGG